MTHLWTPWRSKYITEKKDQSRCIFCDAAAASEDVRTLVVYRGEFTFVILNRYPYTSGHIMIAPYAHVSRLAETSEAVTQEIMRLVRRSEAVLQEIYNPQGLNLGMNLGEAAGAGIEQHIHMHMLPRWNGDANFMTSIGCTRIIPETLEKTYVKLLSAFKNSE